MTDEITIAHSFAMPAAMFERGNAAVLRPLRQRVKDGGGTTSVRLADGRYTFTVTAWADLALDVIEQVRVFDAGAQRIIEAEKAAGQSAKDRFYEKLKSVQENRERSAADMLFDGLVKRGLWRPDGQ